MTKTNKIFGLMVMVILMVLTMGCPAPVPEEVNYDQEYFVGDYLDGSESHGVGYVYYAVNNHEDGWEYHLVASAVNDIGNRNVMGTMSSSSELDSRIATYINNGDFGMTDFMSASKIELEAIHTNVSDYYASALNLAYKILSGEYSSDNTRVWVLFTSTGHIGLCDKTDPGVDVSSVGIRTFTTFEN